MANKVYDVIVVGTGAGGSTAMKTLCEAGLNVLALNSGPRIVPSKHYRNHRQRYELKYRGFGDPKTRHLRQGDCEQEATFDLFEHDITYTVAPGAEWKWTRCKGTGGKANFWGRSPPALPKSISKPPAGTVTMSIGRSLTEKSHRTTRRIERTVGVASSVQNRPSNPDGEYLPPFQLPLRRSHPEGRLRPDGHSLCP